MADASWVHCNRCYFNPYLEGRGSVLRFFVTACGHLFCQKCVNETPGQCSLCRKEVRMMQIESGMKADTKKYFMDPHETFRRSVRDFSSVLEFQAKHRQRFLAWYFKKTATMPSVAQLTAEIARREEAMQSSSAALQNSQRQVQNLQQDVERLRKERDDVRLERDNWMRRVQEAVPVKRMRAVTAVNSPTVSEYSFGGGSGFLKPTPPAATNMAKGRISLHPNQWEGRLFSSGTGEKSLAGLERLNQHVPAGCSIPTSSGTPGNHTFGFFHGQAGSAADRGDRGPSPSPSNDANRSFTTPRAPEHQSMGNPYSLAIRQGLQSKQPTTGDHGRPVATVKLAFPVNVGQASRR